MKMDLEYTVEDCLLIDIPTFSDERGIISVLDKELPFEVKRVFWLYHISEGKNRGAHALLHGSEIMISLHGSFVVDLFDGGKEVSIPLNNPGKGLLIRPGIWFATHSYKEDGVSLILASEEYARERYTYDYNEYLQLRECQCLHQKDGGHR